MKKAPHPREVIGSKKEMQCKRTGKCEPETQKEFFFGKITRCRKCGSLMKKSGSRM